MAVTAAMVVGNALTGVVPHLVGVTLGVRGTATGDSSTGEAFLGTDRRCRNQGRRYQTKEHKPGAANHGRAYHVTRCLSWRERIMPRGRGLV